MSSRWRKNYEKRVLEDEKERLREQELRSHAKKKEQPQPAPSKPTFGQRVRGLFIASESEWKERKKRRIREKSVYQEELHKARIRELKRKAAKEAKKVHQGGGLGGFMGGLVQNTQHEMKDMFGGAAPRRPRRSSASRQPAQDYVIVGGQAYPKARKTSKKKGKRKRGRTRRYNDMYDPFGGAFTADDYLY